MPNSYRGEYQAELGGELRTFRFSLNKMAHLEDELGSKSINEVVASLNDLGFKQLRFMVWLAINEYDHETKEWSGPPEHEVGEWELDVETIGEHLKAALERAFRGGRTEEDEDEEEDGEPAADPPTPTAEKISD